MANPEHLELIKKGKGAWYSNTPRDLDLSEADLREADLREANLVGAQLGGADLWRADLTDARLEGTDFAFARLTGANLTRASLNGSNLTGANLQGANLTAALLAGVNFSGAKLGGADMSQARIAYTTFADIDLSTVTGLESVQHQAPSSIGVETLYKSGGKIPEAFLRGCGVPDDFLTFAPSFFGMLQPIQFYSCFISYSTKDEEFARRLHSRMRDEHLRVWFAPEEIKGGQKLHEQIERAIHVHDRLLLVLSEDSIQSEWVMTEIRNARNAEILEKRRKLFPIRLVDFQELKKWKCFDADHGKDLAAEVREYFIPDFSTWKDHDSFEAAFTRLLAALRKAESTTPT